VVPLYLDQVELLYCCCNPRVEFVLRANKLIADSNTKLFGTLYAALDYAEEAYIRVRGRWTLQLPLLSVSRLTEPMRRGGVALQESAALGEVPIHRRMSEDGTHAISVPQVPFPGVSQPQQQGGD
jgi:hypothetical protein